MKPDLPDPAPAADPAGAAAATNATATATATGATTPTPAAPIERLFRYAARSGRVHPLQLLLQRYRAGERA